MKLIFVFFTFVCMLSCKKETPKFYNTDLKNKSISSIKEFLDGKWQLHYAYINRLYGVERVNYDSARNFITFYPVDSILWKSEVSNNIATREKVRYSQGVNSYNENATKLLFYVTALGYDYNWTPDRMINDTLVFVDNGNVGSSYFLTRVK